MAARPALPRCGERHRGVDRSRHADRLRGHHLHWAAARYTPRIRERGNDSRGHRWYAPRCTARQRPGPTDHAGSQERRLRDLDGESRPRPVMGSCRRVQGVRTSSSHTGQPATIGDRRSGSTTTDEIPARIRPSRWIARGTRMRPGWTTAMVSRPSTRPPALRMANGAGIPGVSGGAANGYTGLAIIVDWDDNARVFWEGLDRCGGEASIDGSE